MEKKRHLYPERAPPFRMGVKQENGVVDSEVDYTRLKLKLQNNERQNGGILREATFVRIDECKV